MTCSTLPRVAPSKPENPKPRSATEQTRKEQADRAFEEDIQWFLSVSRRALAA